MEAHVCAARIAGPHPVALAALNVDGQLHSVILCLEQGACVHCPDLCLQPRHAAFSQAIPHGVQGVLVTCEAGMERRAGDEAVALIEDVSTQLQLAVHASLGASPSCG